MAESGAGSPGRRDGVSTARLYLLRALYLLNFGLVGFSVWPQLVSPSKPMPLMEGVALSFYAALSTLSLWGLRYPLQMMPLLFVQLFYKSAWLLAVAIPLSSPGPLPADVAGAVEPFVFGALLDIVVIPWAYVVRTFLLTPGDRWRFVPSRAHADVAGVPPH